MLKLLPAFVFNFFEYSTANNPGTCSIFWQRKIKKLLFVSLIACTGAVMHPAAAQEEESSDVQNDFIGAIDPYMIFENWDDIISAVTIEQFNSFSDDDCTAIINEFIERNNHDDEQDAFFDAVDNNLVWALDLLMERGAQIDAITCGDQTALHRAAMYGHQRTVKFLIENGADKDAADSNGRTPLHIATRFGQKKVIKLLIENGADEDAVDRDGYTPMVGELQSSTFVDDVELVSPKIIRTKRKANDDLRPPKRCKLNDRNEAI